MYEDYKKKKYWFEKIYIYGCSTCFFVGEPFQRKDFFTQQKYLLVEELNME